MISESHENKTIVTSPGFVTNADKNTPLDFVFILGVDRKDETCHAQAFEEIKKLCESRNIKYAILGNGKIGPNPRDFSKLSKAKNCALFSHGSATPDGHIVKIANDTRVYTAELLGNLQFHTEFENLVACACKIGQVVEEMKLDKKNALSDKTNIVAYSSPTEASYMIDNVNIILSYVKHINPGKKCFLPGFESDIAKMISQTAVLGYWHNGELFSQTLWRENRKNYLDPEKYTEYQINLLNNFYNNLMWQKNADDLVNEFKTEFPHIDFDSYEKQTLEERNGLLQSKMSAQELERFYQFSFERHISHGDIEIVDNLLGKLPFPPNLMSRVIEYHGGNKAEQMLRLILKHNKNATSGQTVNAFMTQSNPQHKLLGFTPLTWAIECNSPTMVKVLLEHGADIFLADEKGNVPIKILKASDYSLRESFFQGPLKNANFIANNILGLLKGIPDRADFIPEPIFQEILSKQAAFMKICSEENDKSFGKGTYAFPKNKKVYDAYYQFVKSTSQVNLDTILAIAVEKKLDKFIKDILSTNFFASIKDAVINGNLNLVKAYLLTLNKKQVNEYYQGDSLLITAVKHGHVDIVKELIKSGAKINVSGKSNKELLEVTVASGNLKIFDVLIDAGAKVEKDKLNTLFFIAVRAGHMEIAKKIQEMGADIKAINKYYKNCTAFHVAAGSSQHNVIDAYWNDWKSDINTIDDEGNTPLHYAVASHIKFSTIEKMLNEKADLLKFNYKGRSPFHLSLAKEPEFIKLFLNKNPILMDTPDKNKNYPLSIALEYNNTAAFIFLLKRGADYLLGDSLANKNLSSLNFTGLKLSGVNLYNTNLHDSDLRDVILIDANLEGANLIGAKLAGADLTGANLTNVAIDIRELLLAKSLRDIKIDADMLKYFSQLVEGAGAKKIDYLKKFKDKMIDDYKVYLEQTNDVAAIVRELEKVINDETHPLKYQKQDYLGLKKYDISTSYSTLIDIGRERLITLLRQPGVIDGLDKSVRESILNIAKTPTSSTMTEFTLFGAKTYNTAADKLIQVILDHVRASKPTMKNTGI